MSFGDAAAKAAIQLFDQEAQALDRLSQLLARILANLSERAAFTRESNDGIKALLEHLKKGGKVDTTTIAKEDAAMVDEILRTSKIPFVMAYDSKEGHVLLMTRDTDRDVLQDVLKQYAIKKGTELQEIEAADFLKAYEGKEIRIQKGLDRAEVALFREKTGQYNCTYAVLNSAEEPGKFEIMYPRDKAKACEDALKDVSYDFAGEEGRKYKETILDNLKKREIFMDTVRPADEEMVFVCSKNDPTKFIAITHDGFSVHDIQTMREKLEDGKSNVRLVDRNTAISNSFNKEKLAKCLDQIKDPVLLSSDEFPLVRGISMTGVASFVKDAQFKESYEKVVNLLFGKEVSYPRKFAGAVRDDLDKPRTYEKLVGSQVDEIMDKLSTLGLSKYIVEASDMDRTSIAFPDKLTSKIQPVVDEVLFKGLSGADLIQKQLLHDGRGTLDIHKAEDVVIDASLKGIALFFEKNGVNIVQSATEEEKKSGIPNKSLERISRKDPEYDAKVLSFITQMKEPVVIDKGEYRDKKDDPAAMSKLIRSRIPSEHESSAEKEYQKFTMEHKKGIYEQLHSLNNDVDHMDELTERQQEAAREHYSRKYEDIYVSRSTFEKLSTLDFTDKRYARTEMFEQTTTTER
nr:hypothetical protein [uncultured Butyrivibrio sp.]